MNFIEKMEKSLLLKTLGDNPKLRIIDFLLDNKLFDFSKKEMIEGTHLSKTTFYKYFEELEEEGVVKIHRKFGKARLYKLNEKNPVTKLLIDLDLKLGELYANLVEKEVKEKGPVEAVQY